MSLQCFAYQFRKLANTSIHPVTLGSALSPHRVPRTKAEFLEKMLFMPSQSPPDSRLLKVAVVGFPNVGKSSLVNMLVSWRVCAVSGKAHTTRSKQTVVFTKDNVQLAFVDLPGLVSSQQIRQFKLERTFIRDPHAAIFDADLVLVVVDASNRYARKTLDPEVLKVLHFFDDKESVLVLNKVDKLLGDRTRLLEITRCLTGGLVGGRQAHCDAFMNKFNERAKLIDQDGWSRQHLSPEAIIFPLLPLEAHEAAQQRLQHIERIYSLLSPTIQVESASPLKATSHPRLSPGDPLITSESSGLTVAESTERCVTDVEHQTIEDFFVHFKPSRDVLPIDEQALTPYRASSKEREVELASEDARLEGLLERVRMQMMLNSASEEEVALRRQKWRELSIRLQGAKHWAGFSQVFMVSAATGEGIDKLRRPQILLPEKSYHCCQNYLLERAKPDRQWVLSPSLITDLEPSELIRMSVWAHCLDQLPKEIPYNLAVTVDECEHVRQADGDGRVYVHVRLRCPNERTIRYVVGTGGKRIRAIASAVKQELSSLFQAPTLVKLTAEAMRPTRASMRRMRAAKDFAEVFPNFDNVRDNCDASQRAGIESAQV
ncbi:unnamed protein product [Hydatigera taeniaeformis]|uniref:GTPase Era, mitochondrial n=1 Tax=Hydatigena taeniaeformis TaxID=6205 RepID=A0A0R3XAG1_HYDTA|nr:unnamed protein product [Hydatigera taeniaeformis]